MEALRLAIELLDRLQKEREALDGAEPRLSGSLEPDLTDDEFDELLREELAAARSRGAL